MDCAFYVLMDTLLCVCVWPFAWSACLRNETERRDSLIHTSPAWASSCAPTSTQSVAAAATRTLPVKDSLSRGAELASRRGAVPREVGTRQHNQGQGAKKTRGTPATTTTKRGPAFLSL